MERQSFRLQGRVSKAGRQGFTLLDSLIVIVILGIVAVALAPQFAGVLREAKINEAAGEIVSGLQYAGNLAIRYKRPFGFQADASGRWFKVFDNQYYGDASPHIDGDPPCTAYGVVLNPFDKAWYLKDFNDMGNYSSVTFTSALVVFYPDGHSSATDTTVTMSLGSVQRTITVDGTTGRVSVQ